MIWCRTLVALTLSCSLARTSSIWLSQIRNLWIIKSTSLRLTLKQLEWLKQSTNRNIRIKLMHSMVLLRKRESLALWNKWALYFSALKILLRMMGSTRQSNSSVQVDLRRILFLKSRLRIVVSSIYSSQPPHVRSLTSKDSFMEELLPGSGCFVSTLIRWKMRRWGILDCHSTLGSVSPSNWATGTSTSSYEMRSSWLPSSNYWFTFSKQSTVPKTQLWDYKLP